MPRAALALVLAACWTGSEPPPLVNHEPPRPARAAFEITMRTTSCFGTCPVYEMTIHADGRVEWNGIDYVQVRGRAVGHIDPVAVRELERELDVADFFGLTADGHRDNGPVCQTTATTMNCSWTATVICSDTPESVITVRRGGRTNTVSDDHCSESPLAGIEQSLSRVAQQWIGNGGARVFTPLTPMTP